VDKYGFMRKITRVRQRRDALRLLAGVGGGFDEGRRRPLVVSPLVHPCANIYAHANGDRT
jgi:hypothetical protein